MLYFFSGICHMLTVRSVLNSLIMSPVAGIYKIELEYINKDEKMQNVKNIITYVDRTREVTYE